MYLVPLSANNASSPTVANGLLTRCIAVTSGNNSAPYPLTLKIADLCQQRVRFSPRCKAIFPLEDTGEQREASHGAAHGVPPGRGPATQKADRQQQCVLGRLIP
jgi:hypothetical protein